MTAADTQVAGDRCRRSGRYGYRDTAGAAATAVRNGERIGAGAIHRDAAIAGTVAPVVAVIAGRTTQCRAATLANGRVAADVAARGGTDGYRRAGAGGTTAAVRHDYRIGSGSADVDATCGSTIAPLIGRIAARSAKAGGLTLANTRATGNANRRTRTHRHTY